ncbi:MAG TPA: heme ABC transporter permease CcmB [Coriobacteriia bacterium]|nr:heme ABC transporter permease CcmB [Coriobacteriia bacterium]
MTQSPVLKKPTTFSQYKALLAKDLRQEFRTRDMLTSMGIYAVLVLIVFGAAFSQMPADFDIIPISGGLIWALIVFTSLLGLNRSFSHEKEEGSLQGILLVPLDRAVIFLSKATSNLIFLLLVEIITIPLFYFFFLSRSDASETLWLVVAPLLVGTIGIVGIGTLLATITMGTRGKDVLLAVLFIPLSYPLLFACVSATTAAIVGDFDFVSTFVPALAMAGGYDVVMILVSWLLYDYVVSA